MPQASPGSLRSPRKRALEIGTAPGSFVDDVPYCPQGGHPITPDMPADMHEEPKPAVSSVPTPAIQGSPFGPMRGA